MKKTFDKNYFLSHRGCYERQKMEDLCDINKCIDGLYTLENFLNWDIPIKDKFYFVRNYCEINRKQKQFLSLECAKISLKFYTAKYPNDNRVSDCIYATEKYLNGEIIIDTLIEKRNAVVYAVDVDFDVDVDDADVADAADYAADVAAAAVAVAVANDVAADVAAAAAAADATYAADSADAENNNKFHTNNLLQMLKDFCNNQ